MRRIPAISASKCRMRSSSWMLGGRRRRCSRRAPTPAARRFEFSVGAQRFVVNCGAPDANRAAAQQEAARMTAAHSTLVVDDRSSCRFAFHAAPAQLARRRDHLGARSRRCRARRRGLGGEPRHRAQWLRAAFRTAASTPPRLAQGRPAPRRGGPRVRGFGPRPRKNPPDLEESLLLRQQIQTRRRAP